MRSIFLFAFLLGTWAMAQRVLADPILECGLLAGEDIAIGDCLRTQLDIISRAIDGGAGAGAWRRGPVFRGPLTWDSPQPCAPLDREAADEQSFPAAAERIRAIVGLNQREKGALAMQPRCILLSTAALATVIAATPAAADTLKSGVAFNTGIHEKTGNQPADGLQVSYQITLKGGDLDGCTVDIVESLYGRDDGAWGIFDIQGDVKCDRGGFSYTSSGAWDGNGFHAAGDIEDGSGSGDFEGISGRVAQLNGGGAEAGDNTTDISYDLVFDTKEGAT